MIPKMTDCPKCEGSIYHKEDCSLMGDKTGFHERNLIYYSRLLEPESFPKTRMINLRFKWLARTAARILNKIINWIND